MAEREVSTRLILQGEKEYRAAIAGINRDMKTLDSQIKLVDSSFEGQRNTLAALEARNKALNDVIAKQTEKLNTEKTALSGVQKLQADYAKQAADARAKLETLSKTTDDATKETDEYKEAVKRLQAEIARNEAAEGKCAAAVANHTTKANQAQVKLNELNRELQSNDKYLDEAKASADGCAKSIDEFGKEVKAASSDAAELGVKGKGGIDALAGALAAAGVTATLKEIAGALIACTDASIEFESAMAGVAKTTDMTEDELNDMGAAFLDMSLRIPITASELAQIAEAAGQLGIAKGDMTEFTEIMAKLGTATDMTSGEAATMLAQFAAVTGMDPSKYSNLGSAIVGLGNNFSTTEKKITEMAQATSGAGANAGMSEADILALSTAVTSLGIEATTGGTNMSKLIGDIQTAVETGKELNEWAAAAGMSATEFSALWGVDAVGAIRAFIVGLGDTDESMLATLSTLGITEARTTRMITSLANAEKKNGTLTKAIGLSNKAWAENNALNKEAATRFETTESKVQLYQNSVEALKIAVGDRLTPTLGAMADVGTDINKWLTDFVSENKNAVPIIGAAVAAVGAATGGLTLMGTAATVGKKAVELLNTTMTANPWMGAASAIMAVVAAIAAIEATTTSASKEANALIQGVTERQKDFSTVNEGIKAQAEQNQAMVEALDKLMGKEEKTAADKQKILDLVKGLNEAVPTLNLAYDDQADQLTDVASGAAVTKTALLELIEAEAKAQLAQNERERAMQLVMDEIALKGQLAEAEAELARMQAENVPVTTGLYRHQEKAVRDLQTAVDDNAAAQEISTAALMDYATIAGEAGDAADGAAGGVSELTEAERAQVAQFEELQTQLTELTKAYEEYYEKALANISGVVSGFDEVTQAETKSIQDSMAALDSQLSYLTTYSDNLLKLKELADANGVDLNANLVAKLSDGSAESAAILQGIVDDGGAKLADLNSKFGTVEQGKQAFATIVAEMETDFKAKTDAMVAQMQTMVAGLNQSDAASEAARATVSALNASLVAGISATESIVNRYSRALAQLGRTRTATLSTPNSHAAGLYDVPYDNYPASLHKGERVLTALQAQALDAQEAITYSYPATDRLTAAPRQSPIQQAQIDYDRMGQKMAEALDGITVAIDGEKAGKIVAGGVSQAQEDEVTAGRFGV